MSTSSHTLHPNTLSEDDRRRLRDQLDHLKAQIKQHKPAFALTAYEGVPAIDLPNAVGQLLMETLNEVADGHVVSLATDDDELTTQEAADLLNVSRPHLVKLLKDGQIPYHKVGAHHRVRRRDLLAYKTRQRQDAEEALQTLADQAQDLGLGY